MLTGASYPTPYFLYKNYLTTGIGTITDIICQITDWYQPKNGVKLPFETHLGHLPLRNSTEDVFQYKISWGVGKHFEGKFTTFRGKLGQR